MMHCITHISFLNIPPFTNQDLRCGISDKICYFNCRRSPLPKEERAAVSKLENKDEDVLFEVRVKLYTFNDGEMKAGDAGVVQLLQLKNNSYTGRLVMRNGAGKVQLDVSIPKGMVVKKNIAKGGKIGHVLFRSLCDIFRLKTKIEN